MNLNATYYSRSVRYVAVLYATRHVAIDINKLTPGVFLGFGCEL